MSARSSPARAASARPSPKPCTPRFVACSTRSPLKLSGFSTAPQRPPTSRADQYRIQWTSRRLASVANCQASRVIVARPVRPTGVPGLDRQVHCAAVHLGAKHAELRNEFARSQPIAIHQEAPAPVRQFGTRGLYGLGAIPDAQCTGRSKPRRLRRRIPKGSGEQVVLTCWPGQRPVCWPRGSARVPPAPPGNRPASWSTRNAAPRRRATRLRPGGRALAHQDSFQSRVDLGGAAGQEVARIASTYCSVMTSPWGDSISSRGTPFKCLVVRAHPSRDLRGVVSDDGIQGTKQADEKSSELALLRLRGDVPLTSTKSTDRRFAEADDLGQCSARQPELSCGTPGRLRQDAVGTLCKCCLGHE